jgi:GT2 family glycosyltransferase
MPLVVEAISGCMMLIAREVFERTGEFDPDFFFSFEDVDFCLRARANGFGTIVVPAATVLHEGGRSMGSGTARRLYFGARNQLRLARRHGGADGATARSLYVVALNVAHAFRATGATLPARLAAVARGTRDYSAGRFGPGPVA